MNPSLENATLICTIDDILPNTGVCALVDNTPVAIFRVSGPDQPDRFYAIDNIDPKNGASVLSRGLVGNLGPRVVVASPLYKHHFDLENGECLENPQYSVRCYRLHLQQGQIWLKTR